MLLYKFIKIKANTRYLEDHVSPVAEGEISLKLESIWECSIVNTRNARTVGHRGELLEMSEICKNANIFSGLVIAHLPAFAIWSNANMKSKLAVIGFIEFSPSANR